VSDERIERAKRDHERSTFGGDSSGLPAAMAELDAVEAEVALVRGRVIHAGFLDRRRAGQEPPAEDPRELELFVHSAQLYHRLGDVRGEAEALFWIGCCLQVVREDEPMSLPYFERSRELAAEVGDKLTMSYAIRHLAYAEQSAGRLDAARELIWESIRLRREVGFLPGVAANLITLAEIVAGQEGKAAGLALLDEAEAAARDCGANGIVGWAEHARTELEALPGS
jgi:hypothetical protein